MAGSDPQILMFSVVALGLVLSLLGSGASWYLSRAKKVRDLEDLVLGAVRTQEVKLAEWQTTIRALLAEAEDFFDRSVKERKRAQFAANKIDGERRPEDELSLDNMANLPRSAQLELVRRHFDGN